MSSASDTGGAPATRGVSAAPDSCAGCALDRRGFVQRLAVAALAAGAGRDDEASLAGLPVRLIAAVARNGASATYPLPSSDSVNIDRSNDAIVARAGGRVFVFARTCPHQNTALKWDDGDRRFRCPKHGSTYAPDGVFIEGRATRSMDRFAVHRDGNTVVANLDLLYQQDTDAAQWASAFITV
ncbi:MAG TPA: Rieske (2Fe-2S) protein [Gemmatimonadaceae bacterium]|nr:Rieske (2Fe-2S) protein [Gemmatimonadaceae bacterium]